MTPRLDRRTAAALITASMLCGLLVGATPASASVDLITCTGESHLTYTPGLTLTPQTVTLDEYDTFSCSSLTEPTITGTATEQDTTTLSCLHPLSVETMEFTIDWDDGSSSTMEFTYTLTDIGGQVVSAVEGSVISGRFNGSTVVGSWIYPTPSTLQCATTGINHLTGPISLTIAGS